MYKVNTLLYLPAKDYLQWPQQGIAYISLVGGDNCFILYVVHFDYLMGTFPW